MELPSKLTISQTEFPNPLDMARDLAESLSKEAKDEERETASTKTVESLPAAYENDILAMVISIWRIKCRMTDAHSQEPKDELAKEDVKKIARYVESIYDSFTRLGIEVRDRTGEAYDYGLPEKVIAFQAIEEATKEEITETMRPTIYWNNAIVQQGEVIVATPISKTGKSEL